MENSSNFREIVMGKIAPNSLYRSEHPIFGGKQVKEITLAANSAKIKTIINLSDNSSSLKKKMINCPWYKKIFEGGGVIALNINMDFTVFEKGFCEKIKKGLLFMIEREPPYLIHCQAGIDRTGYLSALLEALMGAGFDDIARDYMLSFYNNTEYPQNGSEKGEDFMINFFSKIKGALIDKNENLRSLSEKYILEKIGLSDAEIKILTDKLDRTHSLL